MWRAQPEQKREMGEWKLIITMIMIIIKALKQRMQSHNEPKCGNTESKQTTTVHTTKMECIAKREKSNNFRNGFSFWIQRSFFLNWKMKNEKKIMNSSHVFPISKSVSGKCIYTYSEINQLLLVFVCWFVISLLFTNTNEWRMLDGRNKVFILFKQYENYTIYFQYPLFSW